MPWPRHDVCGGARILRGVRGEPVEGHRVVHARDGDAAVGSIVVEVFESERFFPFLGWQEPKGQLDEFFTARFSRTVSGKR